MTNSAATPLRLRAAGHLRQRDITVLGVVMAMLKVSMQQVLGQAAGEVADSIASTLESLSVAVHLGPVDAVTGALAAQAGTANAWTSGLAGAALLLLLPVGGPVWAGLVPVGITLRGAQRAAHWGGTTCSRASLERRGSRGLPATCNVPGRVREHYRDMTTSILVVDDSADFRELAVQILRSDGFDVVGTASSGAEALAGVARLRPRAALVDVHLGADSGFELARQLDADDHARLTSVVLMSSHTEDELAELLAESPAAGFVAKERLSGAAVRAVLAGSGRG